MHIRKIAAWPAYLLQVLLLRHSESKMKQNGLCSLFQIIQKKKGGGVLHSLSLNAVLFYCELNWSGIQEEEEEFEMQRAEEGQGEGSDKGWEA